MEKLRLTHIPHTEYMRQVFDLDNEGILFLDLRGKAGRKWIKCTPQQSNDPQYPFNLIHSNNEKQLYLSYVGYTKPYNTLRGENSYSHLKKIFAYVIDVDVEKIISSSAQEKIRQQVIKRLHKAQLMPSYIVYSGTGLHLIYKAHEPYSDPKYAKPLIKLLINKISDTIEGIKNCKVDRRPVTQAYRYPGMLTKKGDIVKAYDTNGNSLNVLTRIWHETQPKPKNRVLLNSHKAEKLKRRPEPEITTEVAPNSTEEQIKAKVRLYLPFWIQQKRIKQVTTHRVFPLMAEKYFPEIPIGHRYNSVLAFANLMSIAGCSNEYIESVIKEKYSFIRQTREHPFGLNEIQGIIRGACKWGTETRRTNRGNLQANYNVTFGLIHQFFGYLTNSERKRKVKEFDNTFKKHVSGMVHITRGQKNLVYLLYDLMEGYEPHAPDEGQKRQFAMQRIIAYGKLLFQTFDDVMNGISQTLLFQYTSLNNFWKKMPKAREIHRTIRISDPDNIKIYFDTLQALKKWKETRAEDYKILSRAIREGFEAIRKMRKEQKAKDKQAKQKNKQEKGEKPKKIRQKVIRKMRSWQKIIGEWRRQEQGVNFSNGDMGGGRNFMTVSFSDMVFETGENGFGVLQGHDITKAHKLYKQISNFWEREQPSRINFFRKQHFKKSVPRALLYRIYKYIQKIATVILRYDYNFWRKVLKGQNRDKAYVLEQQYGRQKWYRCLRKQVANQWYKNKHRIGKYLNEGMKKLWEELLNDESWDEENERLLDESALGYIIDTMVLGMLDIMCNESEYCDVYLNHFRQINNSFYRIRPGLAVTLLGGKKQTGVLKIHPDGAYDWAVELRDGIRPFVFGVRYDFGAVADSVADILDMLRSFSRYWEWALIYSRKKEEGGSCRDDVCDGVVEIPF